MKRALLFLLIPVMLAHAQPPYRVPSPDVVAILDAPPTPMALLNSRGTAILLVQYNPHPSISLLARPILKLAGVRIDQALQAEQRTTEYTGMTVRWIQPEKTVPIQLPANARIGSPRWSFDGKSIAFMRDTEKGVELWVADAASGKATRLEGIRLNDILTTPYQWMSDNIRLLVHTIPADRGPRPTIPAVPVGPVVDETAGKVSRMATFQDLLKTPDDEQLFAYYAMTQLVLADARSGALQPVGSPAMIVDAEFSPSEEFLLVTRIKKPFSYRVPYDLFARSTEIWNADGNVVATIADLPVSDEIPQQGVATGPRAVRWQPLYPAKLIWLEALDGGDPLKKVPHRDKIMSLGAPFTEAPAEVMKTEHRAQQIHWLAQRDVAMVAEYNRDRRWRTTALVDLTRPSETRKVMFDLSVNDSYHDPGSPMYRVRSDGTAVLRQDGDWIFTLPRGATDKGDLPRLDRWNINTLKHETIFQSREQTYESVLGFVGDAETAFVTRYESPKDPPNFYLVDLGTKTRTVLTDFKDPAPQFTGLKRELIRYVRPDGVPLSGTLYLPPGTTPGTRLPLIVWAYPLEYSDAGTAGQVRGSPYRFTFLRGASPLFFLTQGYAVLMDATMPVVGDPETVNNTFVEQVVSSGRAAIDKLDSMGVIDRKRVCVSGHSYGAFMTANLLAHSDDFAAGIARSGAYNRSLTPFGFQSERRSFWEAPETYMRVSPFTYAHTINEPLLMIHGEADNNPGTFTIQSERLFQAIRGNGGTARLVLLPLESHGYTARESVLHTLVEMFEWADRYVKNRKVN